MFNVLMSCNVRFMFYNVFPPYPPGGQGRKVHIGTFLSDGHGVSQKIHFCKAILNGSLTNTEDEKKPIDERGTHLGNIFL